MRAGRITASILFLLLTMLTGAEPLDTLRANLKELRTFQAKFTQKKRIGSIGAELAATGEIALDRASGRMAWRVRTPIHYLCLISETSLTQWDADSGKTIRLDAGKNPSLKLLLGSMKNCFSGNFDEMEKDFTITLPDAKTIRLIPREGTAAAQFVAKLEFTPSPKAESIERVAIYETCGDVTRIEYRNIRINQEIPAEKWHAGN